jgi:two-component system chemotaxis response regulator CheY
MARVLIIDDDKSTRDALRRAFEIEGYEVEEALNGLEGLERYRQEASDVVITDLHMPGKDGLEMTAELKREFPDAKVIAISAMSQSHNYDFKRAAEAMGAERLIEKPFRIAEVMQTVQEVLGGD